MSNCRRNNRLSCRELIDNGITTCREGLAECQAGLDEVYRNNVARGLREIRNGKCLCQQGIDCCQRGINRGGFQNSNTCSGLRECRQAVRNINFGCCEIKNNNVGDGTINVEEGIRECEEGLNRIISGLNNLDVVASSFRLTNEGEPLRISPTMKIRNDNL